ncbi:hypothetical protein [Tahibacter harae]|uniref:Uncharacterized protein n=1 Tax=Tahibacter harae TaxID=2963937 RepID=A0ABT1QPA5_9GAMM|nr:hypothetical protein [Tahibacter harae]MCQ4164115.1 hypothetical protein [Tahibacter harae]
MELPPPLAPWRAHLSGFDPAVAGVLVDLLRRLQPLLGPANAHRRHGQLHYDGVDGLQRNGSYDRLLPSEWVLAEVEPEEFLRRAAVGEHLFLAPRRVQPRSRPLLVAVFDSGPNQLGAPRLVHIALALLLAQRAAALGAQFVWACLQERGEAAELSQPEHLQRLLRSRSLRPADAADAAYWNSRLAVPAPAECWLIGAGAAPGLAHNHAVDVQRRLDGQLDVEVRSGNRQRGLLLQPPPDKAAVRLLRGEFAGLAAPPASTATQLKQRLSLAHAPLLDWRGQRLGLALLDRTTLLYVRLQPGGRVSRTPLHWRRGASLLGAVLGNSNLGGVLFAGDALRGWNLREFKRWPRPPAQELACVPGQAHWLRGVLLDEGAPPLSLLLLDHGGNLVEWVWDLKDPPPAGYESRHGIRLQQNWRRVLALHQASPRDVLIARVAGDKLELVRIFQNQKRLSLLSLATVPVPDTVFLAGKAAGAGWQGCCAHAVATGRGNATILWQLLHLETDRSQHTSLLPLPAQCQALGLVRAPETPQQYGLLVLDESRRRLRVFAPAPQALYLADAPIVHATVSDDGERVALLTERREVLLLEAATRRVLLHLGSAA